MEKFRKFDDASCGINPFVPVAETGYRPIYIRIPRTLFSILIFIIKLPLILFVLLNIMVLTILKYVFVLPVIIRPIERIFTWMFTKIIMMVCSANHAERRVHPDHLSFDFIKANKGELFVDDSGMFTDKRQLILSNHINPMDFVYLAHHYCPVFTKVVMYTDTEGKQRAGIRELGMFEVVSHAIGLRFPQIVQQKGEPVGFYKDL